MKKPDQFYRISLVTLLLLSLVVVSCVKPQKPEPPVPVSGLLDLRNWDFEKNGNIELKGEWQFYFKEFYHAGQMDSINENYYLYVPGVWKNKLWNDKPMPAHGYATYRLKVLLPEKEKNIGIKINDQGTAFRFFINDSLVALSGVAGKTKATSRPQFLPHLVFFSNNSDTTNLTFWVSNFHYRKGGLWKAMMIGSEKSLSKYHSSYMYYMVFMLGMWFMVAFVLFAFYIYRPSEKANLYLLLWALCLIVRILTADERLLIYLMPHFPFEIAFKLELISGYGMLPFFIMAMKIYYPEEFKSSFVNFAFYSYLLLVVFLILTKAVVNSHLVIPYQIISVYILVYCCYKLGVAVYKRRTGALIIELIMISIFMAYMLEIALYNYMVVFRWASGAVSIGFLMAFINVLFLARTFSQALSKVESFASEMESTVQERTQELIHMQEKLIAVAKQTENERIRRRISQDIHDDISSGLNKISWMGELAKIKASKNKQEDLNQTIDKIIKSSRETVDNLIEIIWSLNPNSDDLENLLVYMRNYINRYFEDTPYDVVIDFPEHPPKVELNPELKRNLFLVMKEALNNAVKYSGARNITIRFVQHDNNYIYSITDDGVGMEDMKIQGTGNGMVNMRKRMESLKGTFSVKTGKGEGTSIILEGTLF